MRSDEMDSLEILAVPFRELLVGLLALDPQSSENFEKTYKGFLVGAKDFTAPSGDLGAIQSRKCFIGLVKSDAGDRVQRLFRNSSYQAGSAQRVWTWLAPSGDVGKPTRFYAASAAQAFLVVTNVLDDLYTMIAALTSEEAQGSGRVKDIDWETLHDLSFWAVRSFSVRATEHLQVAGVAGLPSGIRTLLFDADIQRRQSSLRAYTDPKVIATTPKVVQSSTVRLEATGPGLWQADISLSRDSASFYAIYEIFARFGFGEFI